MSAPDPLARSDVVAALRRAGCVFAEDEARLLVEAAPSETELATMLARRVSGAPLEHVLGWVDFFGLRIAVDDGVFVPRRRSEFLVELAARSTPVGGVVADLCCGCGALGVALASVTQIELYATDIDPAAVSCARRNAAAAQVVGAVVSTGDLFEALPVTLCGRLDTILVNAPYVPTDAIDDMPREARLYEPRVALDGGVDGMDVHRRVVAAAPDWLAHGGAVLIETSTPQASVLAHEATAAGLESRVETSHRHGATVLIGTRPGSE